LGCPIKQGCQPGCSQSLRKKGVKLKSTKKAKSKNKIQKPKARRAATKKSQQILNDSLEGVESCLQIRKKVSEQREPRNINLNFMSDRWWKIPFPTR